MFHAHPDCIICPESGIENLMMTVGLDTKVTFEYLTLK